MAEEVKDLYPQHTKLRAVKEHSQAIGDFLDWLSSDECATALGKRLHVGMYIGEGALEEFVPSWFRIEQLLAAHFGIDLNALETEKRAMLETLRETHSGPQKGA